MLTSLLAVEKKEYLEAHDSDEKIIIENFTHLRREKESLIFKKAELLDLAHSFLIEMKNIFSISQQCSAFSKSVENESDEKNVKNLMKKRLKSNEKRKEKRKTKRSVENENYMIEKLKRSRFDDR